MLAKMPDLIACKQAPTGIDVAAPESRFVAAEACRPKPWRRLVARPDQPPHPPSPGRYGAAGVGCYEGSETAAGVGSPGRIPWTARRARTAPASRESTGMVFAQARHGSVTLRP